MMELAHLGMLERLPPVGAAQLLHPILLAVATNYAHQAAIVSISSKVRGCCGVPVCGIHIFHDDGLARCSKVLCRLVPTAFQENMRAALS